MDSNKTLTNAQFKAMFATIDDEMKQIEQLMECPIERTKRKCKKCPRFFSNEATLKHHHFEPPMKKEKCQLW